MPVHVFDFHLLLPSVSLWVALEEIHVVPNVGNIVINL